MNRKNLLARVEKLEETIVPNLALLMVFDDVVVSGRFNGIKLEDVPEQYKGKIIEITYH